MEATLGMSTDVSQNEVLRLLRLDCGTKCDRGSFGEAFLILSRESMSHEESTPSTVARSCFQTTEGKRDQQDPALLPGF